MAALGPDQALFALTLAWTGARVSEVLALTVSSFQVECGTVAIRTLKRRKHSVREVPIPPELMAALDRHFRLSTARRDPRSADHRLWPWSRTTAWRIIKRVMQCVRHRRPSRLPARPAACLRRRLATGRCAAQSGAALDGSRAYQHDGDLRFSLRSGRTCLRIAILEHAMFRWWQRRMQAIEQAESDATALIARFGDSAYDEARRRAREARQGAVVDGNRIDDHWDRVRRAIGRTTGRAGLDTATRFLTGNR